MTKKKSTKAKRTKQATFENEHRRLLDVMLRMGPSTARTTVQLVARMVHTSLAMRMGETEASTQVAGMMMATAIIHLRNSYPGQPAKFARDALAVFKGCLDGVTPMIDSIDQVAAKSRPN